MQAFGEGGSIVDQVAGMRPERGHRHEVTEMSKEQAQQRARSLKRGLFWVAAIGFVVLSQAASHDVVGVTSRQATPTQSQTPSGGGNNQTQFQSPSQGYGFGSGGTSQPLTQTSVS